MGEYGDKLLSGVNEEGEPVNVSSSEQVTFIFIRPSPQYHKSITIMWCAGDGGRSAGCPHQGSRQQQLDGGEQGVLHQRHRQALHSLLSR